MPTVTCTHQGCHAAFTKSSKARAEQALRVHVGRTHKRNINPMNAINTQKTDDGRALLDPSAKRNFRSLLTNAEVTQVVEFIRQRRGEFTSKLTCFRAALKSVGHEKSMKVNSGAALRYFQKAAEGTNEVQTTRKYTRRTVQPVAHEVRVNYCPNCGCNIHAVATGMVMAKIS